MRILVAEPDPFLADFLKEHLRKENFTIQLLHSTADLSAIDSSVAFDLLLFDLNQPASVSPDLLAQIQNRWPDLPYILLSANNTAEERIKGLNAGADDFVGKPLTFAELLARIQAVLRRRGRPVQDVYQFEDLEINRVTHSVRRAGQLIDLSPKEYALLDFLLRNPGRPVTRTSIVEQVWRMHPDSVTNVVDVYINYLRRKIDAGAARPLIRTIRGIGYQIGGNHIR